MDEIKKEFDIGADIGIGLGFTLLGIFIFNIHYFFNVSPLLFQKILGSAFSILGIGGMCISLSKKKENSFFKDIGVAIIIFVPFLLLLIFTDITWLKIIFAIFVGVSLLFVGMATGRSLLREDGSFRINFKSFPRFIIVLLSTVAAIFSALTTFTEKSPKVLDLIQKIFNH